MKDTALLFALNRGLLSKKALARTDLKRTALSAEVMTNWLPGSLGYMMLRPGLGYIDDVPGKAWHIPFVFSTTDTAIIELTDSTMRVRVDDEAISRPAVTAAVTSGDFSSATGWTDEDESGATSSISGGVLSLVGTGSNAAIRTQEVTVNEANVEHALTVVVTRGPVTLKVGSSSGDDDYISETGLGTGTHSLAFTPTGNFHIQLSNRRIPASIVDSITVASSGDMELPTPWGEDDFSLIRYDQSADVIYVACSGFQQRKIERRGTRSWSIVLYQPEDGPFRAVNTGSVTITPSGLNGDITLTASAPLFRSSEVGALFQIVSAGQSVQSSISGANQFTNSIRVTGVGDSRLFSIAISGTWTATVTLQRSIGSEGSWEDVTTYTSNTSTARNDGLDNQIVYYRIGVKTGNYTSGTAICGLAYTSGTTTGVARVTAYSSSTVVNAAVLVDLGATTATDNWSEGAWSEYRGWPSAVTLYEGRLWWAGKDKIWGSVSDAYESFDPETEGDSGPISRSIGSGPVDTINWLLPLQRLLAGGQGAEHSIRSTTFDEPLTPNNFNIKQPSTQGSSAVAAVKMDTRGAFVQKSGKRVYGLNFDANIYDYQSDDLTILCPEVTEAGVVRLMVQRAPDPRIHVVLQDGTAAILLFNPAEDLKCWVPVETDGLIEDVVILPGEEEDKVYYCVKRTVNGATVRYLERWALESECQGGDLNKQADSFVTYSGTATNAIPCHLEGEEVVVWADGRDLGTYTVESGYVVLNEEVENAVVGLYYKARFKSTKLAYGAQGTALTRKKKVDRLALLLSNTHARGLKYGPDFDHLDDLPSVEQGDTVDEDYLWESYDEDSFAFPGLWNTDSRLCLQAEAPKPCTVLGVVMDITTNG